jgi:hypothetical protein
MQQSVALALTTHAAEQNFLRKQIAQISGEG